MTELINSFEKNSLEELRISLLRHNSYYFIDLRLFSAPQRGEDKVPTSSGFTLPIALIEALKNAILKAERALIARELLGRAEKH